MRIFIDARSLLEEEKSGIHRYAENCIHALARQYPEHRFILFVNKFRASRLNLQQFRQYANCEIRTNRIPNKLLHSLFSILHWPSFEHLVGKCDVYFFPNIIFAPEMPHPSVLTVHDLSYIHTPSYYSLKSRIWHRMVRARSMCRSADALIAVSQSTAGDIKTCFPEKAGAVTIIHSALPALPKIIRTQPKHFLFLGNIEERKNISGLLDAVDELASRNELRFPLVLAGKQGYLRRSTKRKFQELQKKGMVKAMGYVTEEEKLELLQSAVALLFPSFYEGFGFPGIEAAYAGIPVVASWTTSLPEILESYAHYINPHDLTSLRDALLHVQETQEGIEQKNPSLLKRTWQNVAQDMMGVFQSTIKHYENRN